MKRLLFWLSVLALFGSFISVSASAAVKAGGTCTKIKATTIYNGYKYTCIKSGTKLVWSKGVKIAPLNPVPTPTPSSQSPSNPTPTISLSPTASPSVSQSASSSSATQPAAMPADTNGCTKIGERVEGKDSYKECRYIHGLKMQWVELHANPEVTPKNVSAQNVSECQLRGIDFGSAFTGFGVDTSRRFVSPQGINRALIVPIDFLDFPGEKNLSEIIANQKKSYLDWISYFAKDKLAVKLDSIDHWVHAPKAAISYNFTADDLRGEEGNKKLAGFAQAYLDLITDEVNLSQYQTIYILFPSMQNVIETDLVPRATKFTSKEGPVILSVFARSVYDFKENTPQWAFWIHETGHDWGLIGHAPGNGFPFGLMQNQSGASQSLSAWDWFLLNWLPDSQVYCDSIAKLSSAVVSLTPLEREDNQTKMIAVALDSHRLLVIESHGVGKWWNRRPVHNYNVGNSGFYGLMAYVVETTPTSPSMQTDEKGAALFNDDGNNDVYKRFTKFNKIDGEASNIYNFTTAAQEGKGQKIANSYIAVLGDSFTIEGIKVTFVETGELDKVKIEKVG